MAVGVVAALTALAGLAFAPGAGAAANYTQTRFAGADRFDTAALIASAIDDATPTAVLARADIYPDALTGAFAAAANGEGPLLLTRSDSVPPRTMQALETENVDEVILLGGTAAISAAVEAQLRAAGYTVSRLQGATRYETAAAIARDGAGIIGTIDGDRSALLSSGQNFPDALSGAPLSFAAGLPSLLTPPTSLHPATLSVLRDLNITQIFLLGGPAAVSQDVEDTLRREGFGVTRLAGGNRSGTSVEVFEFGLDQGIYTNRRFGLARGDTFPDALAYAPLAGRDRATVAPDTGAADTGGSANGLLLTAGPCTLSDEVEEFILANQATWTQGEILGGPEAICPAVAAEVERLASTGFADLTLTSTQIAQGGEVRGQVSGEGIRSVTVSGCGFNNQNVTRDASGNFTFNLPQSQSADCSLTFTTTFNDGRSETDTFAIDVTQAAGPGSATTRPELQSATIQGTVTNGTAQNPQGTTVRYCFDETVVAGNNPALFHLYRADRTQVNPTAAGGANPSATNVSGTNCVDVLFPQLTSTTGGSSQNGVGDITLATVDLGAVTDFQGQTNPEGDAPLGNQAGQQFASGRTQAPDLVSVTSSGTAPSGNAAQSIVTFTFDQPAFIQSAGGAGFSLVLVDGTVVTCTAPQQTGDNTGGAPGTSGNGTTTISVVCANQTTAGNPNGTPLTTTGNNANIARGVVQENTVGTTPPAGQTIGGNAGVACDGQVPANSGGSNSGNFNRCNPMQASDTPDANTPTVELVSVTLQPSTANNQNDVAFFNFDQPITNAGQATAFAVYRNSGDEVVGTSAGTTCVNNLGTAAACPAPQAGTGAQQNQVAVFFPRGTLADVTGGNVNAGAVTSNTGQTNRDDEAGATNTPTGSTGTSGGRTSAPDLTAVAISTTGTFNNQFQATYTFDEAVDLVDPGRLFLHLADGTRLRCTTATEGTNATSNPNSSTVICTAFAVVSGPGSGTGTGGGVGAGTASNEQLGSATLGTVDDGAVVEEGALVTPGTPPNAGTPTSANTGNPEGAELTTGGTGTRTT
jgi:putative cell wall-binding protein